MVTAKGDERGREARNRFVFEIWFSGREGIAAPWSREREMTRALKFSEMG